MLLLFSVSLAYGLLEMALKKLALWCSPLSIDDLGLWGLGCKEQ